MKSLVNAALLSSAALLSACGGGAAIDRTGEPTVVSQGLNTGNLEPTYDAVADTLVASDGAVILVYDPETDYDNGAIKGYLRGPHNSCSIGAGCYDVAAYGETSNGSGTASYINSTIAGYEAAATFIERTGTTEVPTTGTASYTGDYSAMVYYITLGDPVYNDVISGDAALDADFSDMTISGAISNRVDDDLRTYADVSFTVSDISGGAFGGTATGGELIGSVSTTSDGTYSGLLTGDTATEAVGSVYLLREDNNQERYERGIFIVEQTP